MKPIRKVAVLGAGTMGARIAAHFANAGVPSLLLDIVPPDADATSRNKIAAAGLDAAKKSKPAAFLDPSLARLVTIGNFEDDLTKLADVDWIIEAVVENLDLKRALLKKVDAVRKPGTIITTNTSGLPVAKIAEGFSDDFRRSWFGTHFFNPPRYMRLLEIIPTPDTDRALHRSRRPLLRCPPRQRHRLRQRHAELHRQPHRHILGAQRHAPDAGDGFLHRRRRRAHRPRRRLAQVRDLPHHRPGRSRHPRPRRRATPRSNVRDERSDLKLPEFYKQMLDRKWLGDKTKGGFYKKSKSADGRRTARPRLEDSRIPSAPETEIPCARHGEECRRHRSARAHAARPRRLRQQSTITPDSSSGPRSPISGPTPPIASRKFPTPSSKSIAP